MGGFNFRKCLCRVLNNMKLRASLFVRVVPLSDCCPSYWCGRYSIHTKHFTWMVCV